MREGVRMKRDIVDDWCNEEGGGDQGGKGMEEVEGCEGCGFEGGGEGC